MTIERLPPHPVQRIDRDRAIRFTFDGRSYTGLEGDTIGSALYAAGVRVFSRSFKYHRPRGLVCCRGQCPGCLVDVNGVPSVRACVEPLRDGQSVQGQHAWPSVERDALSVLDKLDRALPVGFYYKTFIRPQRLWPVYERVLRSFAGLGRIAYPEAPADDYERAHRFTDVAVVGGGPAGMAAAMEAARDGVSVVLIDDQPELGGRWRAKLCTERDGALAGRTGDEIMREMAAEVAVAGRVTVLPGASAFGLYEDGLLGVIEGRTCIKLRARQVVVATGGIDYPSVFEKNDLPGVMLAEGARRLAAVYGVSPGERVVVAAADDRGIDQALELQAAGVNVVAVLDTRAFAETPALAALRASGTTVMEGHTVIAARGPGRVAKVIVGDAHGGPTREIECDLVALAGGFEPAAGLIGQAGGRLRVLADGRLTLDALPAGVLAAGEVAGLTTLAGVIASGQLAGAEAALAIRGPVAGLAERVSMLRNAVDRARTDPLRAYVSIAPGAGAKRFVCLCEDVTDKDLRQAVAEGFDHIETLKRYSTVTMGPCQGKMCHRLSIDVCAHLTGRTPEETGATTARPPAQPVPLGALAARSGDPWKLTAMHHHHVDAAARLMDMGPWKRPLAYPMRGVGEGGSAVDQECRAVHERVGLIDVSTLGKLEIVGRDAAAFLDWLHPNRFSDMKPGRVRYRIMCDDAGIVLDDGVVARLAEDRFLLTTGTGTIDAIEQWFEWWLAADRRCAHVVNVTGALAAVNLAGPRSRELLQTLTDADVGSAALPYMSARTAFVAGVPCTILRIGFVGELGFEIHFPSDYGEFLWETLTSAGRPYGIREFGVEAQRVLRLEKQHVIVAQDTDALTTPFGAGLGALVRLEKPDFIGRDALIAAGRRSGDELLVGFELAGAAVPGEGAAVVERGRPIGRVTSARWSGWLGKVIGLAWVPAGGNRDGQTFEIRLDGGTATARVVTRPFYDPDGARLRS